MSDDTADDSFAGMLRELRTHSGLSFEQLARRTFTSASSLHRYCTGRSLPTDGEIVLRIAQACGAGPAETGELTQRWKAAREQRTPTAPAEADATGPHDDGTGGGRPSSPAPRRALRVGALPALGVVVGLIVGVGGAPVAAVATTAPAESGCITVGKVRLEGGGQSWAPEATCRHDPGTPVYPSTLAYDAPGAARLGVLRGTLSQFVCWVVGRPDGDGNPIWYYARNDGSDAIRTDGWVRGFVPARYLHTTFDPAPGLAACRTAPDP